MSPLRNMPEVVVKKIKKKNLPWELLYELGPAEIGELFGMLTLGKYLHQFLKLVLVSHIQHMGVDTEACNRRSIHEEPWGRGGTASLLILGREGGSSSP